MGHVKEFVQLMLSSKRLCQRACGGLGKILKPSTLIE